LIPTIPVLALACLSQLVPAPSTRVIRQVPSGWQVDYTFRHLSAPDDPAAQPLAVSPSDLAVRLSGYVSASRLPLHAIPRRAAHNLDGGTHVSKVTLRESPEPPERCAEKFVVLAWPEKPAAVATLGRRTPPVGPPAPFVPFAGPPSETGPNAAGPFVVEPGGLLNVRLVLTHEHDGPDGIEILVGRRELNLHIAGPAGLSFRDTLDLSRERSTPMPDAGWRPMDLIPADYRDEAFCFSPPYSLVLDATESGRQYYRFPERKVRGGERVRLSFRYFIARGTEGEFKFRVAQYRESPSYWRVVDGGVERAMTKPVGRWAEFGMVFRVHDEATTLALDFRIADVDVGLVWVDDVVLDYVDAGGGGVGEPKP
jgi:hypothetical protein